ncbi:hypothetical protein FRC20_007327, partial [Serendipita sp. 405]
ARALLPSVDTCANIDVNILTLLNIPDATNSGHLQACLCASTVGPFVQANAQASLASSLVGEDTVVNALLNVILGMGSQCMYPVHAVSLCLAEAPCDFGTVLASAKLPKSSVTASSKLKLAPPRFHKGETLILNLGCAPSPKSDALLGLNFAAEEAPGKEVMMIGNVSISTLVWTPVADARILMSSTTLLFAVSTAQQFHISPMSSVAMAAAWFINARKDAPSALRAWNVSLRLNKTAGTDLTSSSSRAP